MGSEKEFAERLVAEIPYVRRMSRRYCRDPEDAAQTTLLDAWAARDSYNEEGNIRGWLNTIRVRAEINRSRRTIASTPCEDDPDTTFRTIEDTRSRPDSTYEVREILAKLGTVKKVYREAFELWLVGYTDSEIAGLLGTNRLTVRSRCNRARAHLMR